jgi:Uma2 family endonuclease
MTIATTENTETVPPNDAAKKPRVRKAKDIPGITRPMSYEEYLAGPEEMARYDIIDGWKIYRKYGVKGLPSPTQRHQDIVLNLGEAFRAFQRSSQSGRVMIAPRDVFISQRPSRTRQPDVLFISNNRLENNVSLDNPAPLSPAPELVVEVLSPSDSRRVQTAKIADYVSVGVQECWLVSMEAETVEVLGLTGEQAETLAVYGRGQTVASVAFPGLTVAVDTIFTE